MSFKEDRNMPPRTSAEWIECFRPDKPEWQAIDFTAAPGVTRAQLAPILRSIQAWQLGETSDGRHLREAARRYAARTGDHDFTTAIDLFIREEQRHGEALGRFLDALGAPRITCNWGDSLFRLARYLLPSMELWTTVVIMVETMALLFYRALGRATPSPLLKVVCDQILRDEVQHLRFQYERLAGMHARRCVVLATVMRVAHRALFVGVVVAVWADHHRLLRAGGYSFRRYWSQAWRKMHFHWSQFESRRGLVRVRSSERGAAVCPIREAPSRVNGWLH